MVNKCPCSEGNRCKKCDMALRSVLNKWIHVGMDKLEDGFRCINNSCPNKSAANRLICEKCEQEWIKKNVKGKFKS